MERYYWEVEYMQMSDYTGTAKFNPAYDKPEKAIIATKTDSVSGLAYFLDEALNKANAGQVRLRRIVKANYLGRFYADI